MNKRSALVEADIQTYTVKAFISIYQNSVRKNEYFILIFERNI